MSISIGSVPDKTWPTRVKTAGGVAPNWNMIPHKGMTSLSKEDIIAQTKDIGVQFANAATEPERERIAQKYAELNTLYCSLVSPDRKALYDNAVNEIKKQAGGGQQNPGVDTTKNIFDFLNERDGIGPYKKGMQFDRPYSFAGGGSVRATYVSGGGVQFDVSLYGEKLLSINAGGTNVIDGVTYWPTKAETAMSEEIGRIWHRATADAIWMNQHGTPRLPAAENTPTNGSLVIQA